MENKTILITGGTGSWGYELTRQLLDKNPKEIIIFSRGELAQVTMQRTFKDKRLKFMIGDVRDLQAVESAMSLCDICFHLAALKHVPICEDQPQEAIKTNINGTCNLVEMAWKYDCKFIDVSTDKAVSPVNLYGMTKAVGERLSINKNFVCIRGGNVLGSNGSVVPYFIDSIKKFNSVTITSREMTRFFLTLPEAIALIFQAVENSKGGETFVMNMPGFNLTDLVEILIEIYGDEQTEIIETGIRPGEKIHEVLISEYESRDTYVLNENYFVISPYKLDNKVTFKEFSSKDNLQSKQALTNLLRKGGFI